MMKKMPWHQAIIMAHVGKPCIKKETNNVIGFKYFVAIHNISYDL